MTVRALERIEALGNRAAAAAADRLAAEITADLPGVRVVRDGSDVVIEGIALARRSIDSPVLRWPAAVIR